MFKFNLNKTLLITGGIALAFLVAFLFWWRWESNIIGVKNEDKKTPASLTGLSCNNYAKRPFAVMMASDPITRPLSGISQADIVVEMPVTPNGITRMMALFQCDVPEEIGSIRSAREDFLPFVANFGALFAHWGGEREVLNRLNNGILDNIDAMKYEGTVFYRKNYVPKPHNGFTTIKLLTEKAEELGYVLDDSFGGYLRTDERPERNLNNIISAVSINYAKPYDVVWNYDGEKNKFKRTRGGKAEIDRNTGEQVETNVVVMLRTTSKVLNRDYVSVVTTGEGEAEFYQNGIKTSGTWKNVNGSLRFYSTKPTPTPEGVGAPVPTSTSGRDVGAKMSEEIKFVSGKMWIEVTTN